MNLTRLNGRCSGFGGQLYHKRNKSFPVQFDVKKAQISIKRKIFTSSLPDSVGVHVTDSGGSSTTIGHGFAKRVVNLTVTLVFNFGTSTLIFVRVHMNIFFIVKVEILLLNLSDRSSQSC